MNLFKYITIAALGVGLTISQAAWAQTAGSFEVQQQARNITKQNLTWTNSLQADAGDRIEFQVSVVWRGAQPSQSVFVREVLAEKLVYAGNLKLDGVVTVGDITKENINIGILADGQTKMLTFETQVTQAGLLDAGTHNFANTVTVFSTEGADSATSFVSISKPGVPTDVATGVLSVWMILLVSLLAIVFVGTYVFFLKYYLSHEVLTSKYENRTDRKLATLVKSIQKQEE